MPKRASPAAPRRMRGFTLIEVLIALAITAIGLAALLANASFGLGGIITANRHIQATREAQSLLAKAASATYLAEGEQSGSEPDGGFWRVVIAQRGRIDQASLGTRALGGGAAAQGFGQSPGQPGQSPGTPPVSGQTQSQGAVDAGSPESGANGPLPPDGNASRPGNALRSATFPRSGVGLFSISATVGWQTVTGTRQVTLNSMRLSPLPAATP